MDVQFQQVMPILHSKMDTMSGIMEVGIQDLRTTVGQNLSDFRSNIEPALNDIGEIQKAQAVDQRVLATSMNLIARSLKLLGEGTFETRLWLPDESTTVNPQGQNDAIGGKDGAPANPLIDALMEVAKTTHIMISDDIDALQHPSSRPNGVASSSAGPSPVPAHSWSNNIFLIEMNHTSVTQLWEEWHKGVYGRKSIAAMVELGYKKSEGQRKLYSRRKLVIDEVERLAAMRVEPACDVVKAMDAYMAREKLSMTKLQDLNKQRTKEGKTLAFWLDVP